MYAIIGTVPQKFVNLSLTFGKHLRVFVQTTGVHAISLLYSIQRSLKALT